MFGQFDLHNNRSQKNPDLYLMYIPEQECFNIQEIVTPQNEKVYGTWIISYFQHWDEMPWHAGQENYKFLDSFSKSTFKLNKDGNDEDTSGVIYPAFIKRDTSIYKEDVPFGRYTFYDWQENRFIDEIYMDIMPS
jgi:hypothetical protein